MATAKRRLSTSEYHLPVKPKANPRAWNYAYAKGAGADRGKRPSYPIDPPHVASALSRSAQKGTAGSVRTVRAAVAAKYGSVGAGLAANRRWTQAHRSTTRTTTRARTARARTRS